MKITNGSFSRSVRQWWWTHQSPRLHQLQVTVRCRHVSDITKGKNSGTCHYHVNGTATHFTSCASKEQISFASVSGVAWSVSNSIRTGTFTSSLRFDNLKQKICNIANTPCSFRGCNTSTNMMDLFTRCACLHSMTTATYVPRSCISCTEGAFFRSSAANFNGRTTRLICSALGRLAIDNSSTCTRIAEFSVDEIDGNTVGSSRRKFETCLDAALPAFEHSDCVSRLCYQIPGGQKNSVSYEQVDPLSITNGELHWITKHHISKTIAASPTPCCPRVSDGSHIRPSHVQRDSIASKHSLNRDRPTQTYNWLLDPRGGLHVSLPFAFFATRSLFLGKKTTKAGSDIAINSCGSATLSDGQSTFAHEARGTFSVMSSKRGDNGIIDTTQSTRHASTSSRESSSPVRTEEKPLSVGIIRQNNGISQLKVAEDKRIVEKQKTPSGLGRFPPFEEETKSKEDALPHAESTASGKDKAVLKSAKIPLSKKLGSFIFGFFFASGCSFFIMYCQVADATLILQQIAKDATHRLAVLENKMLELEKRVRNC